MAVIPPFFLDSVVALGIGDDPTKRRWIGTGFLFGQAINQTKDGKKYRFFLISNKHVLNGNDSIWVKFNASDMSGSKDYRLPLKYRNGRSAWVGHPEVTVDIGAIFLNANTLQKENRKFGIFRSDEHVADMTSLISDGVSEGDGVFALGFPMNMVDTSKQFVICRSGAIARIRDMFDSKGNSFLVDAPVFPGNSGGPVILKPEAVAIQGTKPISSAILVGIVYSYVPYTDVAVSQQTGKVRTLFEENSGLTLVHHAGLIKETVQLANKRFLARQSAAKQRARKKK